MAGRHSKRPGARARIPEQRGPRPLGITDAQTHLEHLVTEESLAAHRYSGRLLALCGIEVLAASLTDPRRGRCRECGAVSGAGMYFRSNSHKLPAGRRSSPTPPLRVPGGQPVPGAAEVAVLDHGQHGEGRVAGYG